MKVCGIESSISRYASYGIEVFVFLIYFIPVVLPYTYSQIFQEGNYTYCLNHCLQVLIKGIVVIDLSDIIKVQDENVPRVNKSYERLLHDILFELHCHQ